MIRSYGKIGLSLCSPFYMMGIAPRKGRGVDGGQVLALEGVILLFG